MQSDNGASKEAANARDQEQKRQTDIRSGTDQINKIFGDAFNDTTFAGRRQGYLDYALPQAQDQYKTALKNLTFSLARNGTLDSSTRAEQEALLERQNTANVQQIGSQAVAQENQSRGDVESARANLIAMLNGSGNTSGVVNNALTQSRLLTQEPAYSPIGAMFADTAGVVANQVAQERAAALSGGAYRPAINTGLFAPSSSVSVTR